MPSAEPRRRCQLRRLCAVATDFRTLVRALLAVLVLALPACLGQGTPTSTAPMTGTPQAGGGVSPTRVAPSAGTPAGPGPTASPPPVTSPPSPTIHVKPTPPTLHTPTPTAPTPAQTPSPGASVTPAPVAIISFTVSPPEIAPGQSVTLTWQVIAEKATLYRLDELGRFTLPEYDVPISGTLTITPPERLRNQVRFALIASADESHQTATASAIITCPDIWFFPGPPAACPYEPHYTTMAAERFERGLMLWAQFNDFIYVLYSDGQSPKWDATPNAWFEGMPESDPSVVPPPGYYAPVRGFGKAWRENKNVRERLGWAIEKEYPLQNGAYQCDTAPRYVTCFVTGPRGQVYVLQPERSGWYVWTGPGPTPTPSTAASKEFLDLADSSSAG